MVELNLGQIKIFLILNLIVFKLNSFINLVFDFSSVFIPKIQRNLGD